jgi:septum formation topological specificity factor MinE
MNQLTIDGVVYKLDALSDAARQQLANLQVTDAEIQRLQSLLAIARTARAAYIAALKKELPAVVCH